MIQAELKNRELTKDEILDAIKANKELDTKYTTNELYFKGENPTLLTRPAKEDSVPDNRVTVPFARKIALTTKNYLFNGPIGYEVESDEYKQQLEDVLYINDNDSKVQDIGLDLIVHGIGYKLFYIDAIGGKTFPRYAIIDQNQGVPIYSIDIEPKLLAFIRYYTVSALEDASDKQELVEVYYDNQTVFYNNTTGKLEEVRRATNPFKAVPAVVYGDGYHIGVFDPVKRLIDALDVLVSSNINEVQRFEMLYMVLKGDRMPDDPDELDMVLKRRIFEISENGSLEFLQKNLDATFIMELYDRLTNLIHNMSNVPDFMDKTFAAESGIALQYKLIGFEQMAADIEAEFIKGEMASLDLVNKILFGEYERNTFYRANPDKQITITVPRNLPEDYSKKLEDAEKMKNVGVTLETIFKYLPMIDNAQDEVKKSEKEKLDNMKNFQASLPQTDDEVEE
jgi:SPP1 family phage portal protein